MKDKVSNEEAMVTNIENPIRKQAHELEEQYSRPFLRDKKDEDIRECNSGPLSFRDEIQESTLVEEKNNELANEEELLVIHRKKIENVLVEIGKFNFPIDFVTLGMEED